MIVFAVTLIVFLIFHAVMMDGIDRASQDIRKCRMDPRTWIMLHGSDQQRAELQKTDDLMEEMRRRR